MATIEYLTDKLENILNNIFKKNENKCRKIQLKHPNKENILYSLKDVIRYFSQRQDIDEENILELEKIILNDIHEKNKYTIKKLKQQHQITSNMTIESYMNYQTLMDFKESEMNDIYVDKIGVYKSITIIQPTLTKAFKEFVLNMLLDVLDSKINTTKDNSISDQLCKKFMYLTNIIDALIDSNIQLLEKNRCLSKKNQILDENMEALHKDVTKTKEVLLGMLHSIIDV